MRQSYAMGTAERSRGKLLEVFCSIVVGFDLRRASLYAETELLHHSTTIKLVPLFKLINNTHINLKDPQEW